MRIFSYYERKRFNQNANRLMFSTILKGDNLYKSNSTFISLIYTFPWRETNLFTRQVNVQIGKSILIILSIMEKCRHLREINTLPSISSLTDRVFSILRPKKYGSDPSEMHIKVVIPAPTQLKIT